MTETCRRPCPSWCELAPGHPWETEYEGRLERHHEVACDPEGFTRLGVVVTVRESAAATDDGDDVIGPSTFDTPTVCGLLDDPLTGQMTPAQARALARALDAAAHTAEHLAGAAHVTPAGRTTSAAGSAHYSTPTTTGVAPVTPAAAPRLEQAGAQQPRPAPGADGHAPGDDDQADAQARQS